MEEFLRKLGIENSIPIFSKYELTLNQCPYISDIDLKELIPNLGDRTKFRMAISTKMAEESSGPQVKTCPAEKPGITSTLNMVSTFWIFDLIFSRV